MPQRRCSRNTRVRSVTASAWLSCAQAAGRLSATAAGGSPALAPPAAASAPTASARRKRLGGKTLLRLLERRAGKLVERQHAVVIQVELVEDAFRLGVARAGRAGRRMRRRGGLVAARRHVRVACPWRGRRCGGR